MIDLGVDDRHCGRIYGKQLLVKVEPAKAGQMWTTEHSFQRPSTRDSPRNSPNTKSPDGSNLYESIARLDHIWPLVFMPDPKFKEAGHELGLAVDLNGGSGAPSTYSAATSVAFEHMWNT
jgi:hypothetical protein